MEEWRSGGVEEWRSGGVEEWRSGGVEEEWRSGGVGDGGVFVRLLQSNLNAPPLPPRVLPVLYFPHPCRVDAEAPAAAPARGAYGIPR